MPEKPAWEAMQETSRKKAARVCQSRSFRNVIIVGSRKSLLSLHPRTHSIPLPLSHPHFSTSQISRSSFWHQKELVSWDCVESHSPASSSLMVRVQDRLLSGQCSKDLRR